MLFRRKAQAALPADGDVVSQTAARAPKEKLGWFEAADLAPVKTETLEGGELTVKLWLARKAGQPLGKVMAA